MKRIIIADDSGTARMFIRRCLEIMGCEGAEFVEAENGLEAIDRLKEAPTDLLFSDLYMPEMDGVEMLKQIKSSPRLQEIPVLMVTSAANPKKIEELKEIGAFAILSKPVSPADISKVLEPLLKE